MSDNFELPEFQKREFYKVLPYVKSIFADAFVTLINYEDKHFRVIFKKEFFIIQEGETEVSKSQWTTLKKKFKRRDRMVFLYKETGQIACDESSTTQDCYYLDFGFFIYA